jgi:hypothetical protein
MPFGGMNPQLPGIHRGPTQYLQQQIETKLSWLPEFRDQLLE